MIVNFTKFKFNVKIKNKRELKLPLVGSGGLEPPTARL